MMTTPRFILAALFLLVSNAAQAQLTPECQGKVDSNLVKHDNSGRAFLANYSAASLIMTPLGPMLPNEKSRASVGVEVGYIPPLSCQQRTVWYADKDKTENTNVTPVMPRIRLGAQLPSAGPISFAVGLSFVPPIPLPIGNVLNVGGDFSAGWRSSFGLSLALRGHMSATQATLDVIPPVDPADPAVLDQFHAASFGGDVGVSYQLPWEAVSWLTPFASGGYSAVRSLTYIGDDAAGERYPDLDWSGALVAGGLQALLFDKHLEIGLEVSSAIGVFTTVKGKIGFNW